MLSFLKRARQTRFLSEKQKVLNSLDRVCEITEQPYLDICIWGSKLGRMYLIYKDEYNRTIKKHISHELADLLLAQFVY